MVRKDYGRHQGQTQIDPGLGSSVSDLVPIGAWVATQKFWIDLHRVRVRCVHRSRDRDRVRVRVRRVR